MKPGINECHFKCKITLKIYRVTFITFKTIKLKSFIIFGAALSYHYGKKSVSNFIR